MEPGLTVSQKVSYPTNLTFPSFPWFSRFRSIGRKLLRLPILNQLKPVALQALSVAHPPTYLFGKHLPTKREKTQGEEITVLSANLWHDWPYYRRLKDRLESFASLVESKAADIVLLQEVARTARMRADEWLADRLGMAYFYIRANGHQESIGFEEGLAILSRYPLNDPLVRQLGAPTSPFTRRLALSACVETPFGGLRAFCAHLGLIKGHNARQVANLHEWVNETTQEGSALIGGDFNAHETTTQIVRAKRSWLDTFRLLHPEKDGATHELKTLGRIFKRTRRDYLFLQSGNRCWEVLEAAHLRAPHIYLSDHQIVMARLKPVGC